MPRRCRVAAVILAVSVLLVSHPAFSQTDEQAAYCTYVVEEASAQRNLLRTPTAVSGVTRSNTGTQPQVYWGITSSLANYSKGKFTMDVARTNCEVYRASTAAAWRIQYALAGLESDALQHRAGLI